MSSKVMEGRFSRWDKREYLLPSFCSSYLVNEGASGISIEEKDIIDLFVLNEGLEDYTWIVEGEQHFSWSNDLQRLQRLVGFPVLGGNVYDFIALKKLGVMHHTQEGG